jgi:hypothetical protein
MDEITTSEESDQVHFKEVKIHREMGHQPTILVPLKHLWNGLPITEMTYHKIKLNILRMQISTRSLFRVFAIKSISSRQERISHLIPMIARLPDLFKETIVI